MAKLTENENSTKYWAERQENYVADFLEAKVQPGSGAGKWKKGDINAGEFLVECKTAMTQKEQFTIKKDWLNKVHHEMLMNHKQCCALAFNFGAEEKHNYFILDEQTFKNMKEAYETFLSSL